MVATCLLLTGEGVFPSALLAHLSGFVCRSVAKAVPAVPPQDQDSPGCEDRGHQGQRRRPVGGAGGDGQRQDHGHPHLRAQRPGRRGQVSPACVTLC